MTAINSVTDLSREGDVAVITINNPPVNALGLAVREGLIAALDQVGQDAGVKAIFGPGSSRATIVDQVANTAQQARQSRNASLWEDAR